MNYTVLVETSENIEVEAESAEAAVEAVKARIDPRVAASARFQVLQELVYNEETKAYTTIGYTPSPDLAI